eukprot:c24175_g1_i1 orf=152-2113(+)
MAAGEKKQQGIDRKLARKFIRILAKELVSDSERGFCLARNTQDIKDALLKSADSLPTGKLRSTLLLILQQESLQEAFVSAVQNEIRVLSAKLELHNDVLLTPHASDHLFQTLVTCDRGKGTSLFTDTSSKHVFSREDIVLLASRDPAPDILWALAAMNLSSANSVMPALKNSSGGDVNSAMADGRDDVNSSAFSISLLASALLRCLKPWIINRNVSVAVATLAPLAPLVFESLQQSSSGMVSNIKALQALVKEVLSFIVVSNYKEHLMNGSLESGSRESLSLSALYDGFAAVFKGSQLQGIITQMEGLSASEKLKLMFPLASEVTKKFFSQPDVKISVLADIVRVEFMLLHIVLEVIYRRCKKRVGDELVKNHNENHREQVKSIAINGVAGIQHDLILDILLSDLCFNNLLDDNEESFVRFSIFKSLLLESNGVSKKHMGETSIRGRKSLGTFLKRIAVARKINTSQRTQGDILDDLACYSKVPHKLVEYLKSHKTIKKVPVKGLWNDQDLIGWLLRMDDMEFKAVVDGTSISDSQGDEKTGFKQDTVRSSPDRSSMKDMFNQDEPEALFFLDITGEEKGRGDDSPSPVKQSRKSRKRKERPVLFHRRERVTKRKEDECPNEGSSDSSADSIIDHQSFVRVKRTNQGGESSSD